MTISTEIQLNKNREYWTECGKALQRFCTFCKNDPRIDTILMPVYDGVTFIKWKQ
jgi:predicted O-methyltransferase YrrM